jgi:hypothetical protein
LIGRACLRQIKEAMRSVVSYAALLFVAKVLKEAQGLVYLNVKQAAFTDLASDTFAHVRTSHRS